MQTLAEVVKEWLSKRQCTIAQGAERLRISPRTLSYLLDGRVPHRSTFALIEAELAAGAGILIDRLREIVEAQRSAETTHADEDSGPHAAVPEITPTGSTGART